jgi:hypothetical protein
MIGDKGILQPFFEDLIYVFPENQLPPYKFSKSDPPTGIKFMHAVGYQDCFFLDILTIEDWTDWLPQNIGTQLPLYAV